MKVLRGAVIGCGVISPSHLASYAEQEQVEISVVCDIDRDKAEKRAAEFGVGRVETDYRRVMEDKSIDFVSVCTPHGTHGEIVLAALENGKHVMCEKILDCRREMVDAMDAAAQARPDLVTGGIFQHRYEKINILIRDLIQSGVLGDIASVSLSVSAKRTDEYYNNDAWRGTKRWEGGGLLINQEIHYLDLLRYFFGEVESLQAICENRFHRGVIEVEDTASIMLRFKSGVLAAASGSTGAANPWHCVLCILGTKGIIETADEKLFRFEYCDKELEKEITEKFAAASVSPLLPAGQKAYYGGAHLLQLADFIRYIRAGKGTSDMIGSLANAARTARLVLDCYRSSEGKCTVTC